MRSETRLADVMLSFAMWCQISRRSSLAWGSTCSFLIRLSARCAVEARGARQALPDRPAEVVSPLPLPEADRVRPPRNRRTVPAGADWRALPRLHLLACGTDPIESVLQ